MPCILGLTNYYIPPKADVLGREVSLLSATMLNVGQITGYVL